MSRKVEWADESGPGPWPYQSDPVFGGCDFETSVLFCVQNKTYVSDIFSGVSVIHKCF